MVTYLQSLTLISQHRFAIDKKRGRKRLYALYVDHADTISGTDTLSKNPHQMELVC